MPHGPVLELLAAEPAFEASALPNVAFDLRLLPGECALIEAHDPGQVADFADLCSGMLVLRDGRIRCMGHDWSALTAERAAALRGRIGRTHLRGGWPELWPAHVSIMLPQLHHTRDAVPAITQQALALSRLLGLPGLPLTRADQLSAGDLARAALVRAFLGEPHLLLLESSIAGDRPDLTTPFLELLARALDGGAAAICFTREPLYWQGRNFPVRHRLLLLEGGLAPMRED